MYGGAYIFRGYEKPSLALRMRAVTAEVLFLSKIPNHLMPVFALVFPTRDMDPVTPLGIVFQDELVEVGVGLQPVKPYL